jgi:SAM-dependent methyltransferase
MQASLEKVTTFLKLTDRGLRLAEQLTHFRLEDVPENGVILNAGSGTSQLFEREVRDERPDVEVISLDPSVLEKNYSATEGFSYTIKIKTVQDVKQRVKDLFNGKKTIIGIGQEMPFAAGTFDAIVDNHGPAQYPKTDESYLEYLREALRVLKPGKKLFISQVYHGAPVPGDMEDLRETVQSAQAFFAEHQIEAEVFVELDSTIGGKPDYRVGAIVTAPALHPQN